MEDSPTPKLANPTIIPFPLDRESILDLYHVSWLTHKRPSWVKKQLQSLSSQPKPKSIPTRKVNLHKISKAITKMKDSHFESFSKAKKIMEVKLENLFDFLKENDLSISSDLLDKFNQKILSGDILTIDQMHAFYKKAEQLADCLQMYLKRNEYCEFFMQDISFEVFEKGFAIQRDTQSLKQKYPNYSWNEDKI